MSTSFLILGFIITFLRNELIYIFKHTNPHVLIYSQTPVSQVSADTRMSNYVNEPAFRNLFTQDTDFPLPSHMKGW